LPDFCAVADLSCAISAARVRAASAHEAVGSGKFHLVAHDAVPSLCDSK
jgi:hypothetical protein